MPKREKVIQALENCICYPKRCQNCPWDVEDEKCSKSFIESVEYPPGLVEDALSLLKEREPGVMTLEEIQERAESVDPDPVFVETKSGTTHWALYTIDNIYSMAKRKYMGLRVWTSRPTPEQMRETKWEEDNETV